MLITEITALYSPRLIKYILSCFPYLIVFLSSMAIMMIELVAGRIVGSYLGNSFYTWIAIITVILLGTSLGNFLGGKQADRHASLRLLSQILTLAVVSCFVVLLLNHLFAVYIPLKSLILPIRIFLTILITFSLPALFLGAVTPVTAKLTTENSTQLGITIGNIYVWGAIGSISGTFITGFCFIAILGSSVILLLIALMLSLLVVLLLLTLKLLPINSAPLLQLPVTTPNMEVNSPIADQPVRKHFLNPFSWNYTPYIIAFYNSACLMIIEIIAGRLIARHFGNSLYSWTSVIGVILTGLTIGYFVGGRLADRRNSDKYLSRLFGIASCLTLLMPILISYLRESTLANNLTLPWHIVFTGLASILFPTVTLGAISLLTVKLALKHSRPIGFTIGSINAWSIAGSVLGTLSAGFWLIPTFGVLGIVQIIALSFMLISWWLGSGRWVQTIGLLIVTLIFFASTGEQKLIPFKAMECVQRLGWRLDNSDFLFAADSKYQYVKVTEKANGSIRVLTLDSLIHGYINLNNPAELNYHYERVYADLTRRYAFGKEKIKTFFIGGGSYTFPRWVLHQWPTAQIDVAEIDPMVVTANHLVLGLPTNTPIRTLIGDARNVISNLPANTRYDFFYGDAFNDFSVPWHLTTLEFTKMLKSHLKPDGAYLLNIIDNYDNGLLLGASYLTLKKVFKNVYVFGTNPLRIQNHRDTFILVGSDLPINLSDWTPESKYADDGTLLTTKNLNYLTKRCAGLVLTDEFAPIENLLAPVVRRRKF